METQQTTQAAEERRYEARIYEYAEHWDFYVTVKADSEEAARKELRKSYDKKHYAIREVR